MSRSYYNEIDPEAVAVLRELIASGVIAPGDVDGRSIKEVTADDIRGYDQCHFFAGAGLWSVRSASYRQGPANCPERPSRAHGRNGSFWSDSEWIACHDGKARRGKPGIPMLVDGMAGRASVWRLAGNSIVPQLAAEVLAAILEAEEMMVASARLASDVREIVAEMEGRP